MADTDRAAFIQQKTPARSGAGPRGRLALLAGLLFLSACSTEPVYREQFVLTPPASDQARTCIVTCEGNENTCIGNAQNAADKSHCEPESIRTYDTCIAGLSAPEYANSRVMWCESQAQQTFENCTGAVSNRYQSAVDQCRARYRTCYQTCGGTVSTKQVCVRNCDN